MRNEKKPIPGFKRYTIDRHGSVFDTKFNKPVNLRHDRNGYMSFMVETDDGRRTTLMHHRALMLTFYPTPNSSQLQVNHIDGDRSNNSLDNLEWCTARENVHHAGMYLDSPKCIPVTLANVETGEEHSFLCIEDAAKYMGITKDKGLWMYKHPNNIVHLGGWKIKNHYDEWLPEINNDPRLYKDAAKLPCMAYNWIYDVEVTYSSQTECSEQLGISTALISEELSGNRQRMLKGIMGS